MWALFKRIYDKIFLPLSEAMGKIISRSLIPTFKNRQIFTSNGTFIPETDVIWVTGCGAGGNGGNRLATADYSGGGGAAGTAAYRYPINVIKGEEYAIIVGSGNTVFGDKLTLVKGANGGNGVASGAGGGVYLALVGSYYGFATVKFGGNGGRGSGSSSIPALAGESGASVTLMEIGITIPGGTSGSVSATNAGGSGAGAPAFLTNNFFGLTGATGIGGNGGYNSAGGNGSLYGAGAGGGGSVSIAASGGVGGNGILIIEW